MEAELVSIFLKAPFPIDPLLDICNQHELTSGFVIGKIYFVRSGEFLNLKRKNIERFNMLLFQLFC
jgi:hypothetical protein